MYPSPIPSADPESRPNPALIDAAIREALSQPPPPVIAPVLENAILAPLRRAEAAADPAFPRPSRLREQLVTAVDEETEVGEEALSEELSDVTIVDRSDEDETLALRGAEVAAHAASLAPDIVARDIDDEDETLSLRTANLSESHLDPDDDATLSLRDSEVLSAREAAPAPHPDDDAAVSLRDSEVLSVRGADVGPLHADEEETIPLPSLAVVLDSPPPGGESRPPDAPVPVARPASSRPEPEPMPPAPPPPSALPVRPAPLAGGPGLAPSGAPLRSSPIPPAPNAVVRPSPGLRRSSSAPPHNWGTSRVAPFRQSPLPALPPSVAPPPISLDALGQLGANIREALLQAATIESLGVEEEVIVSGLAFVITGQASIQATVAEAEAGILKAGELLYAKSPIADTFSLRLVAESEQTQIALWDAKTAEEALSASPDLLSKLKISSARAQAIVGCSMGAMGERLDESLRTLTIERLETRILQPKEVLAHAGLPVPGMVIIGVGSIELDDDGGEKGGDDLMPGDFLFATEVLGGEAAPATARAGAKGAIVLFGARALAHELLLTCPPLLEIFAGM
jgi:hypothetical protein